MSQRPKVRPPVRPPDSRPIQIGPPGWVVWVAPQLAVGNGMKVPPSRWARWWQAKLLGWRWEYRPGPL